MPEFFAALEWESPLFLLLALLPFITKFIGLGTFSDKSLAKRFAGMVEPHLLPYMLVYPKSSQLASLVAFAAWFFAAIALAGPSLTQPTLTNTNNPPTHKITVVMDISRSMLTQDILPNRMARAKKEMQELLSERPHDRFALIAYAANAYLVTPFTDDHDALLQFTEHLSPTLTVQQGSNLVQALELARKITPQGGHIVLLTDGGTQSIPSDILKAGQRLAHDQIRLMILGIGTTIGGAVVTPTGESLVINGKSILSRLNTELLQSLSAHTQGAYSELAPDASDWQALLTVLRSAPASETIEKHSLTGHFPLFPWFLALSLALFLILTVRGRPLLPLFVIMAFILPHPKLQANPLDRYHEQQGWQALQQNDAPAAMLLYKKSESYMGYLGLGVSHYRQEQWTKAASAFAKALSKAKTSDEMATAHYNLGNAQAQLQQYTKAQQSYQQVLRLQPQHKRARLNLNQVNLRLQKKHMQSKADSNKNKSQKTPSYVISEAAGKDIQDHRPAKIVIPLTGTLLENGTARVQIPSINEDMEPLLRYRFNQYDERNQPLITGNPW